MRFLDTNVLLYAISTAPDEVAKRAVAQSLLDAEDWVLSVQVLQEFYVQATRVTKPERIQHEQAAALIEAWLRFKIQEITVPIVQAALEAKVRFQLSYWDAAIIEAARAAGCRQIYSEDLNAGQDYAGIRVINPFV
ncbi:MAG: PIN domain-containing protein [Caldilinea sp.]|nr:PIN domain-containing protein [Caldilinea sp.]MCB9115121.1 PIN domain-containing protein [Caldilineaceae bacterium]MCO5211718.1 PIN domain-containing protein [Caldilinea sp.]MCW5842078.1 PIN domain-containing protein [Caldilinea sp.]HRW48532.1 PIN domain-containing protein [Caldilinea sp.]